MGRSVEVELATELRSPAATVWQHASSMAGVNAELRPWVRMTHPPAMADLASSGPPTGEVVFRSWLLALGVVPFDRHALALIEVHQRGEAGGGFVEESSSWLQRRWRHERSVEPIEGGCVVTDRLVVEPRLPVAALVRPVVATLFAHRHRQLRRRFGAVAAPPVRSRRAAPTRSSDEQRGSRD